jgi:two-component system CheB/CheR fusion protein
VAIRVRDTGVGIPPALQEKIFDLFVQEESGLARTQGGMGIGLTLVRRVIDLHGGTVAVRSDGAGHGSEFTITLPALPASAAVLPNPPREPQLMAASKPLRILLVEDNHDAAESFSILLGLGGHDVRVAHDGAVALATVEGFSPDVAFIDVGLPGIDGYELAPLLRAHPRCRGSMLIALTGYGREDDKRRASQSGFDHHMTKPVDLAAIDRLLSEASQMAGAVRAEPRHP